MGMNSQGHSGTDDYYEKHALEYFERTVGADMSPLYDSLALVPPGGGFSTLGLDRGEIFASWCGGYRCRGIDASPSLARLAHEYSSAPCDVQRIEELDESAAYDGIWACASLLHLSRMTLVEALARLHSACTARRPVRICTGGRGGAV